MQQEIDDYNKIIHIKCTEEEKNIFLSELTPYLYDYVLNFIPLDPTEEDGKSP